MSVTESQTFGYLRSRHSEDLFVSVTGSYGRKGVWVLCPPILEEAVYCRLDYSAIARRLAEAGYSVIQFDYGGTGDSTGDHRDATLARRLADIGDVCEAAAEITGQPDLFLFGVRVGANLALAASRDIDGAIAVGWYPVIDGQSLTEEFWKLNQATQYAAYSTVKTNRDQLLSALAAGDTVNVLGFELHGQFVDELAALRLEDVAPGGKTLVVLAKSVHNQATIPALERAGVTVREERVRPFWQSPRMLDPHHASLVEETLAFVQ